MLRFDDVFSQIEKLTELDDDGKNKMEAFCESAVATLNSRIRADADGKDIRLIMAAASLAYYRYLQASFSENDELISMKAGDVTVKCDYSVALKKMQALSEDLLRDAGELLSDTAFIFAAV